MQQAKRIAFGAKRFRVVTLGGDLIETSGAMSGGGREKMSGKMGTQIAEKSKKNEVNLEALEAKLQEEEFKLRELNTKRGEAEGAIVMAKRELLNREKGKWKFPSFKLLSNICLHCTVGILVGVDPCF